MQQAVHINKLLQVLPWNCEMLFNPSESQSNLHFTLLVAAVNKGICRTGVEKDAQTPAGLLNARVLCNAKSVFA